MSGDQAQDDAGRAIEHLTRAAETFSRTRNYDLLLGTNDHLTRLLMSLRMYDKAIAVFESSIDAVERMSRHKVVEDSKSFAMQQHAGFYLRLLRVYLDQNKPLSALIVADRLKSRAMLVGMQVLAGTPGVSAALPHAARYRALLAEQRNLLALLSESDAARRSRISPNRLWGGPAPADPEAGRLNLRLDEVEADMSDCLRELELADPAYVTETFGYRPPDLARFFRTRAETGIVTFQHIPTGICVFYLYPSDPFGGFDVGWELLTWQQIKKLNTLGDEWFKSYDEYSTSKKKGKTYTPREEADIVRGIGVNMDSMLLEYGGVIGPSLVRYFVKRGVKHLLFVTYRDNHVVPFAGIRIPAELTPGAPDARCLVELFTSISIVPSLSVADRLESRQERKPARVVAADYNPPGAYLPHSEWEMESILSLFPSGVATWSGSSDSVADLARMAEDTSILHISAHGTTVIADYHQSQLTLGAGVGLTYSDVLASFRLPHNYLVTLSACETGYSPNRMKRTAWDEYVGLDGAFLQAGARAVVSSLWRAYDRPTALLMYLMYRNIKANVPSATALANAQRSLLLGDWRSDGTLEAFNRCIPRLLNIPPLQTAEHSVFSLPVLWAGFKHLGLP